MIPLHHTPFVFLVCVELYYSCGASPPSFSSPQWRMDFLVSFYYSFLKKIGGNDKTRTYTEHRMKVTHYHYATLPNLVENERIELSISGCKPDVFPLALIPRNTLVPLDGIEPPIHDYKSSVIPFN